MRDPSECCEALVRKDDGEYKQCTNGGEYKWDGSRCCWQHMYSASHPEINGGLIWMKDLNDGY